MQENIRQTRITSSSSTPSQTDQELIDRVVEAICEVYDPEIPVNIWELGLIYQITVDAERHVEVTMTLTTPMCPSAQELPAMVELMVSHVQGIRSCDVEIIWEPPWNPDMMTDTAKFALNML